MGKGRGALLVIVWACWISGTADAAVRKPALLVAEPQVNVSDRAAAGLIYSSIIAGLHDGLLRRVLPPNRQYVAVFTERSISEEQKTKIAPIVLFSQFTSQDLNLALERRFKQAQQFRLARFLEITIAELSPANYEVTLTMYAPGSTWTIVADKRVGGCNEPLEEMSARVRDLASNLIELGAKGAAPEARIEIQPPTPNNTYLVGARITLDSCGIENPTGDRFTVSWQTRAVKSALGRRRIPLVLDRAEKLAVVQKVPGSEQRIEITVIESPKAQPVIETCSKGGSCKEAIRPSEATSDLGVQLLKGSTEAVLGSATELDAALERNDTAVDRALESRFEKSKRTRGTRVVRLEPGVNHIRLEAKGMQPNQTVLWTQLSGPEVGGVDFTQPIVDFQLESAKSGYYVFKLVVTAGTTTDEAKLSFLAAPAIHADAGEKAMARVGESILLDASGSYDVLGDEMSFTWVVLDPDRAITQATSTTEVRPTARIIDNHSVRPRFLAEKAGTYQVRLYARVVRKLDEASIVEIAIADTKVEVRPAKFELFADSFSSASTRQIGRVGFLYTPAISHLSTTARGFSYRSIFGLAVGSDSNDWTAEAIVGLGLRMRNRLLLDVYGRFYPRQNEVLDRELSFGAGGSISISLLWHFWIQAKLHLGPPPLYSSRAPKVFAWEPGVGLVYEH